MFISIRLVIIYRMPHSRVNGIKIATFCEKFSDYLQKLSCAGGNVLIAADSNIDFIKLKKLARSSLYK